MRHQFQPEGHLVGPVVVSNSRFQADVEILLVLGIELGPDDFFKAVGFGVNELGVLRNRQVGVTEGEHTEHLSNRRLTPIIFGFIVKAFPSNLMVMIFLF